MTDVAKTSKANPLLKPMRDLYRAYVRLLESGKERIEFHGGTCDSVEQMERGDPYLIAANVAMQAAEIEQRHSSETSDARDAARYRYIRNCLHCPETDLLITSRSKAPAECGVYSTNILDAIVDDAIKATSQKAEVGETFPENKNG